MAKKLEMSVLLAAVDKITGPLKKMRQASGITATQLKETQDRVKSLNKQSAQIDGYRKISRSLGITSNDLAKAQKEVKRLALEMQSSQAPAKALVKEYEQARAATVRLNTQHKNLTISQHRQRESLRSAGVDTRNLSQHQRTLAAELSQANKQLDQQKRRLQQVSDQQKKLSAAQGRYQKTKALQGNMAGAGATAAASGAAALYAGARVLQPGLDFSAGQSKVQALTRLDKNDPQLIALRKQARDLGASTSFTANDVSQGQSFLAMAGFDAKSIKQAMPSMLDLAKANDTDLATTSDIASNILSGFGLAADQMGRLGDVLTATTTRANVNLTMLGDTMKYVAPAARDLGVSVEEAAAMSGLLGNIGIQASQGGTVMRAMLNRLASQSGPAAAAVEYLGLKTKDTAGNLRAVPDILADVVKATKTMGNADRADVLKTIFGEEAGAGVSELIKQQGDGAITSFANVLRNSAGENARVAKTMADNAKGDIDTLKSAWEDVGIEIFEGNDSGIRSFIQQITGVVNGIGNWMRVNPELTGTLFKAAAAMAIVATVGGTLTLMMAGILGPIALLQYSTSVLGINLMGAIAPAGLLTKAFGGLSKGVTGVIGKATNFKGAWAGIGALWKQSDPVKLLPSFASITGGVNRLKASFGALIGRVSAMPHTVMALVKAQWLAVASGTKMAAANAWMATTSAASGIWSSVAAMGAYIKTHGVMGTLFNGFKASARGIGRVLLTSVTSPLRLVGQTLLFVGRAALLNPIGLLVTAIGLGALAVYKYWQPIKAFFVGFWQGLQEGLAPVAEALGPAFTALGSALMPLKPIWDGISSALGTVWKWVTDLLTPINSTAAELDNATGAGKRFGLWLADLINIIPRLAGDFIGFGANLMEGFSKGIMSMGHLIKEALGSTISEGVDYFKSLLGIASPSKVFAVMGDQTMQGLTVGISRSQQSPLNEVSKLSKTMAGTAFVLGISALPAAAMPNDAASMSSMVQHHNIIEQLSPAKLSQPEDAVRQVRDEHLASVLSAVPSANRNIIEQMSPAKLSQPENVVRHVRDEHSVTALSVIPSVNREIIEQLSPAKFSQPEDAVRQVRDEHSVTALSVIPSVNREIIELMLPAKLSQPEDIVRQVREQYLGTSLQAIPDQTRTIKDEYQGADYSVPDAIRLVKEGELPARKAKSDDLTHNGSDLKHSDNGLTHNAAPDRLSAGSAFAQRQAPQPQAVHIDAGIHAPITIHATANMDAQDVARLVGAELDKRARAQQARLRSSLKDLN